MQIRTNPLHMLAALAAGLGISASAQASPITFGSSQNFTDATDVSTTTASSVRAYSFNTGPLDINGVHFINFDSQAVDTKSGLDGTYDQYGTAGQSGDYGTLLTNAIYHDGGSTSITLNNLLDGDTYELQVWVNDARQPACCGSTRTETLSGDAAGTDAALLYDVPSGPPGQFVIGTFIASGTSQVLNLDLASGNSGNNQINGLQLRDLTPVPEPASLGLLSIAALTLLARRRHPITR